MQDISRERLQFMHGFFSINCLKGGNVSVKEIYENILFKSLLKRDIIYFKSEQIDLNIFFGRPILLTEIIIMVIKLNKLRSHKLFVSK